MIKIRLVQPDLHRNEIAFRPYWRAREVFKQVGIEFITEDASYDFAFIAQASFIDKQVSLSESIEKGIEFVSKFGKDVLLLDGQDSHSLIGTAEILKGTDVRVMFKNTLLKDLSQYKQGWVNGRTYWGNGDYSVPYIDDIRDRIKLSGTNWLSTITPTWYKYDSNKPFDVSCMFSWGDNSNYEYGNLTSPHYDNHRKELLKKLENTSYKVTKREKGVRIPQDQFYQNMYNSKIVTAPIGYGEIAVRDIEAASFGSVLLKPDMSHLDSYPFIYKDKETYIACKYDWSDVLEKIDYILTNYNELQPYLTENIKNEYTQQYSNESLVKYFYNQLLTVQGIGHENN
jgi:hypothetical protein